jgi:hypothetical protein
MGPRAAIITARRAEVAVIRPRGVAAMVAMAAVGVTSALALASTIAVIVAVVLVVTSGVLQLPKVRHRLAVRRARRARHSRHRARKRRLETAGVAFEELAALAAIVDRVIDAEPTASDVDELEPLLDHYVGIAIARRQCIDAVMKCDRGSLFRKLDWLPAADPLRRRELVERRIRESLACERRARALDADLVDLGDLVRYYGERSTLPDITGLVEVDPLEMPLARYDVLTAERDDHERDVEGGVVRSAVAGY